MSHTLYPDGGARGNPGPAAAGAVLKDPTGAVVQEISKYLGEMTNNQAEYSALILGLLAAKEHQVKALQVLADSELMVRQIQGTYKVKHPDLKPLYDQAMTLVKGFAEFEIEHIRRDKNAEADALVNQALDAHV